MAETVVSGLRWVKGEIALALQRVTGRVEAYGQSGNPGALGDAADALHEVRGVLLALALAAPARLVEEMEHLCDAAANGEVSAPKAAAEALLLALMRLPAYLDQLDAGVEATPQALWAAGDELRAARGAAAAPSASGAPDGRPQLPPPPADLEAPGALLRQARPRFHRALLEWYRPVSGSDGLSHLGLLLYQLQGRLDAGPLADLFRLARAHATALRCGDLAVDPAARALLGQLDRVFKPLAAVPPQWPGAALRQLIETFLGVLAGAGLERELVAQLGPCYSGGAAASLLPEGAADALAGLAAAALGELAGLKGRLGADSAARPDSASLLALADGLTGLARPLAVAPAGLLSERLRLLADGFRALSPADTAGDAPALEALAAELLAIEATLAAYAEHRRPPAPDLGALGFDAAELVTATLREVCTELVAVKEAIADCQAEGARPPAFAAVPGRLASVAGAMQVLGQTAAAGLCEALTGLIEHGYLGADHWPQGMELELLAEAVTALELHSERVCEGQPEDAGLLRQGGEAIGTLTRLFGAVPVAAPITAPITAPIATPVAEAAPAPAVAQPVAAPGVAPEFMEIFLEEAEEELQTLGEHCARFCADPADEVALTRLRRSFHTLKGSGRMVGALRIGDLAWAAEHLCNQLLERSRGADAQVLAWLKAVVERLPEVVAAEAHGGAVEIADLEAQAARLGPPEHGGVPDAALGPVPAAAVPAGLTDHTSMFVADEALLEIFRAETLGHLAGVRTFLAHATLLPTVPEPETLRALHTLSGSARMAGIDSIALVAKVLEERLQGLAVAGTAPDAVLLGLLGPVVEGVAARVAELPGTGPAATALLALAAELEASRARSVPVPLPAAAGPGAGVFDLAAPEGPVDLPWLGSLPPGGLSAPDLGGAAFGDLEAESGLDALPPLSLGGGLPMDDTLPDQVPVSFGLEGDALAELPALVFTAAEAIAGPPAGGTFALSPDDLDAGGAEDLPILDRPADAVVVAPPGAAGRPAPRDLVDEAPVAELPVLSEPAVAVAVAVAAASPGAAGLPVPRDVLDEAPVAELPVLAAPAAAVPVAPPPVPADCDPCPDDQDLLGVFLEEARDLLDGLDTRFRAWQLAPQDLNPLDAINRLLHTLKGGARLTGLRGISDLSHALETRLTGIANAPGRVDDTTLELAQQAVDALSLQFDALEKRAPIPRAAHLVAALNVPLGPAPARPPATPDLLIQAAEAKPQARPEARLEARAEAEPELEPEAEPEPLPEVPATERPAFLRAAASGSGAAAVAAAAVPQFRVRSDLIDHLVDNAGEIGLYRARLSQRNGLLGFSLGELDQTVQRLREQLRLLELETEAQIIFRFERETEGEREGPVFDPLELDRFSTLQQLSRSLAETVNDLISLRDVLGGYQRDSADLLTQQARLADDLQDGLLRTRMVPFVQIVPRLHRLVRQTAEDLGKSARLTVTGPEVELDRVILNRLVAPLEHLLRNAVDHGLESAAARAAAGKPASGELTLELSREGSEVVIGLSDDGPGLDLPAIRAQAVARGLLLPEAEPEAGALAQFVFEPGFTTQAEVTQISGRGVGLDVVASEIKAANGSIDLQSVPGRGVTFTIRLPLTLAIVKALLVGVGGSVYALPHAALEAAARIGREDLAAIYAAAERGEGGDFNYRGQAYRVASLGSLLDPRVAPNPGESRWAPLLLVRVGDQRVALHVDSLMESTRILIKPLAARLGVLRWLAGATILPDGRVALILDLPALLRAGLIQERWTPRLEREAAAIPLPTTCVMVVDDSLTVRRVTTRMLEHRQIEVMTAKDGVEALTLLDERLPDLILLDVEMPRMDGYELTRHIRQSERLRALPIIMITSRAGAKHRDHASSLGVDRYLGKPYQEGELLAEIASLLAERRR